MHAEALLEKEEVENKAAFPGMTLFQGVNIGYRHSFRDVNEGGSDDSDKILSFSRAYQH